MNKEDQMSDKDILFIMQLGTEIQDILYSRLAKQPDDKKAKMLHCFLTNFVCNVLAQLSQPQYLEENLKRFIRTVEMWMNQVDTPECEIKKVNYNRITDTVKIGETH